MIRFLFRFVGLLFLAAGFIFVVYDGMKSIADQTLFITRIGDAWAVLHAASQQAFEDWVRGFGMPWLWDTVIAHAVAAPASLALIVIGALLILIGRKKRPLIGYARS